ncbi:MAG TPA: alanine--glyoxylate aminotransferase family protein [Candidatus Bathyarchaeia archaeon]|nr:alanine--glyoxylate aminotransferase family protein [Candidatus Bathyarchaeia archaeon]
MTRKILMIPGPSEVAEETRMEIGKPVIAHYGSEWVTIYNETIGLLKKVFQTTNDIFVIPGSSSSAMEASIESTIEPGDKVLVELSGNFGLRFKEIVEMHQGKVVPLEVELGNAVDPDNVRKTLEKEKGVKAMTLVSNETSTGVANPVKELGEITQEYGILYIVDAVSALGGIDLKTDDWNIDFCITGTQKCLETPPGLALTSVSSKAWKVMESRREPIRGWYLNLLNLRRYCKLWADWHPQGPETMPTPTFMGLRFVLKKIMNEGLQQRFERHRKSAKAVRAALRTMGLELFVRDEIASKTLTSAKVPQGIRLGEIIATMESEHNTMIAGGVGPTQGKIIRIGHMGVTASPNYILPALSALEKTLKKLGYPVTLNSGVKAAETVLES